MIEIRSLLSKIKIAFVDAIIYSMYNERIIGIYMARLLEYFSLGKYMLCEILSYDNENTFNVLWQNTISIFETPNGLNHAEKKMISPKKKRPLGYATLTDAYVYFQSPFAIKDNKAFTQHYWNNDAHKEVNYKNRPLVLSNTDKYLLVQRQAVKVIENGILLTGNYDHNWYHWIIETLSKKELINLLPDELKKLPLIVSANKRESKNHYDSLRFLFPDNNLYFIEKDIEYKVQQLILVDSGSFAIPLSKFNDDYGNIDKILFDKQLMTQYALRFRTLAKPKNNNRRIFLARKQDLRSYNQNDLIAILEKYNFDTIFLEEMSFIEQINVFYNASFIVGMTGAAWTNLIFCKPDTKAIIILPNIVIQLHPFANIAATTGVVLYEYVYMTKEATWRNYMYKNYASQIDFSPIEKSINEMITQQ